MAEREGFEPSIRDKPYTPLAGERLQPLGHLSNIFNTAKHPSKLGDFPKQYAIFDLRFLGRQGYPCRDSR